MATKGEGSRASKPLILSALLLGFVFVVGVVGYTILSPTHSVLDAVYMAAITLATVGYGEAIDLSASPGGRLFTVGLLLAGVLSFGLFLVNLVAFAWRHDPGEPDDVLAAHARARLGVAFAVSTFVFVFGVIGFAILSPTHSLFDALFMTVITLTTVGYREVIDLSGHGARLFAIALILGGVASFANLFSCAIAYARWRRPSPPGKGFLADSPYKPFIASTVMMLIIFTIGTVGYTILSPTHSVLDAVYMTVITLTTVGYGEIIDLSNHPEGRVFTIFLLFTGVGTFVYFFSSLTGFIVEGNIERIFRRRKMQKLIAHLKDHYIVSGAEFIARHIVRELVDTERELVLIASSEEAVADIRAHAGGAPFPAIVGDPTDDHNLVEAGIVRARGVFACMEADKDTLILTLSARLLNPNVKIVARCVDEDFVAKIRKAGADQVVSPPLIGGLRMASAMVRPTVVTFLDLMLRDKEQRFRVEESSIADGSRVDGMTAGQLRGLTDRSALLMAVRSDEGEDGWVFNPPDDFVLRAPMTLVYVGSPGAKKELDRISGGRER